MRDIFCFFAGGEASGDRIICGVSVLEGEVEYRRLEGILNVVEIDCSVE